MKRRTFCEQKQKSEQKQKIFPIYKKHRKTDTRERRCRA